MEVKEVSVKEVENYQPIYLDDILRAWVYGEVEDLGWVMKRVGKHVIAFNKDGIELWNEDAVLTAYLVLKAVYEEEPSVPFFI